MNSQRFTHLTYEEASNGRTFLECAPSDDASCQQDCTDHEEYGDHVAQDQYGHPKRPTRRSCIESSARTSRSKGILRPATPACDLRLMVCVPVWPIRQTALANTYDNFEFAVFEQLATIMLERMAGNDQFVNRCLSDHDFKTVIFGGLAKELFTAIRGETDSGSEPRA